MKKTILAYTVILMILVLILYFFSMSWMNFLFRPNLNKELEILISEQPMLHPKISEKQVSDFTNAVELVSGKIGLFTDHFKYFEKLAPAFTFFQDTFTYLDFWEGTLHSASVFPCLFFFRGGKVLVRESIGNRVPPGAEIKAINDQPIDEIMKYYQQFVYASSAEERSFWVIERDLLNYYPEFFKAKEFLIKYEHNGTDYQESVESVPWKEFNSWRQRIQSEVYRFKQQGDLAVLKLYDLSYAEQTVHKIKEIMLQIIDSKASKLLIDLTDTKGIGDNYYSLQMLLSFLSGKEDYLIQKQTTRYTQQSDAFAVIQQNEIFQGDVYFLISDYSIYPYISTLISFCQRTHTGQFIGEQPLSLESFLSNPNHEPLYISYLIPKVCRTYNEIQSINDEEYIVKYFSLANEDYLELMFFTKDYLSYLSDFK